MSKQGEIFWKHNSLYLGLRRITSVLAVFIWLLESFLNINCCIVVLQVISSWRLSLYWKRAPSSCSTSKFLISSVKDLNLNNQNCYIPMRLFCCRPTLLLHRVQETNLHGRRCFSTSPSSDNQVPPQPQTSSNTFDVSASFGLLFQRYNVVYA